MTRLQSLMKMTLMKMKMTQHELANSLNMNRQYFNAVLRGKRLPSPAVAYALARAVGVDPAEIWELTEVGIVARNADNRRKKPRVRGAV